MKPPQSKATNSASVHSQNIRRELSQLIDRLEAGPGRVDDAQFRKLVLKSTEVLKSLHTLFERFGPKEQPPRTTQPRTAKSGSKSAALAAKASGKKPSAPQPKIAPAAAGANRKNAGKNGGTAPAKPAALIKSTAAVKTAEPAQKNKPVERPADTSQPTTPLVAPPKPVDPAEIEAKAKIQRLEARAPQRPSNLAPRPVPPQSGKPVWSKPHSS